MIRAQLTIHGGGRKVHWGSPDEPQVIVVADWKAVYAQ